MIAPITQQGYRLMHEGAIALAEIEGNGMKVDMPYLERATEKTKEEVRRLKAKLMHKDCEEWKVWRRCYGEKANLTSNDQVLRVFKRLGHELESSEESSIEKVDLEFARTLIKLRKQLKAGGTYLKGLRKHAVDGYIHPFFHLHIPDTYRSCSRAPNFHNFPVRLPEVAELVRSAFPSRFGADGVLVENDYKGLEVTIGACYHHDPVYIKYLTDPGMDMHRDIAAQIYFLDPKWVAAHGKQHRYGAKNKFVFPQHYGDYYKPCANNMWEWAVRAKLKGPDGSPLVDWMRGKGIKKLGNVDTEDENPPVPGTFSYHVMQVENDFWNNRFKVFGKWREKWYQEYQRLGYFDTLTGFRISGSFRRNQVINFPVQGSAFHCVLWALPRILRQLRRYKMRSVVAGQIHDSVVGDVYKKELRAYLEIVHQIMTVDIKEAFPWLCIPLIVENEISPLGATWYQKREVELNDGVYTFKDEDDSVHEFASTREFLENFEPVKKGGKTITTGSGKYAVAETIQDDYDY